MITKTDAVKMSIKKWEALSQGRVPLSYDCGFCEFVAESVDGNWADSNVACEELCPLYPDVCSVEDSLDNKPLYWIHNRSRNKAVAKQILEAIKERGEKWIKG